MDGEITTQALAKELKSIRALLRVESHKNMVLHRALVATGMFDQVDITSPLSEASPESWHRIGSPNLVIAFGSKGQGVFSKRPELAGTLTKLPCDSLYYRDFLQAWWAQGLVGLSNDIPSTAEYIRSVIARGGYQRVIMTGSSMGAYAAILFGAMIGVERVVAFAPQTHLQRRVFDQFDGTDARTVRFDFKSRFADLALVLEDYPYKGQIEIFFGSAAHDELHAKRLARFDGVRLHRLDTDDHNVAAELKTLGQLDGWLSFDKA